MHILAERDILRFSEVRQITCNIYLIFVSILNSNLID